MLKEISLSFIVNSESLLLSSYIGFFTLAEGENFCKTNSSNSCCSKLGGLSSTSSSNLSTTQIVIISGSSAGGLLFMILLFFGILKCRKWNKKRNPLIPRYKVNSISSPSSSSSPSSPLSNNKNMNRNTESDTTTIVSIEKIEKDIFNLGTIPPEGVLISQIMMVTQDYDANLDDEMTLRIGDQIEIQRVYDDGWAKGMNRLMNIEGVFPLSAVVPADRSTLQRKWKNSARQSSIMMSGRK